MKLILERLETSDHGTFGVLHLPNRKFFTGELPYRENKHALSCIDLGTYQCQFTHSPAFKRNLYVLLDVKDRFGIRIHAANYMGDVMKNLKSQVNGCIALGERIGMLSGQKAILSSKSAMIEFERLMNGQPFELEIIFGVTGGELLKA